MNHRQEFGGYVREQLERWGLAQQGWGVCYAENWKRVLGRCYLKDKTIQFSLPYIDNNPLEVLKDTVHHEIGHALAGPGAGHGVAWKMLAPIVGFIPRHCTQIDIEIPCRYKAECCRIHRWHRKPRHSSYKCRKCGSVLIPQLVTDN